MSASIGNAPRNSAKPPRIMNPSATPTTGDCPDCSPSVKYENCENPNPTASRAPTAPTTTPVRSERWNSSSNPVSRRRCHALTPTTTNAPASRHAPMMCPSDRTAAGLSTRAAGSVMCATPSTSS